MRMVAGWGLSPSGKSFRVVHACLRAVGMPVETSPPIRPSEFNSTSLGKINLMEARDSAHDKCVGWLIFGQRPKMIFGLSRVAIRATELKTLQVCMKLRPGSNGPPPRPPKPDFSWF